MYIAALKDRWNLLRKLSLLIVDSDEDYLKALSSYLSINYFNEFKITSISSREYFNKYLSSVQGIDILLINRNMFNIEIEKKFINTIILMGEDIEDRSIQEYGYIFKYMRATKIYNEIKRNFILENPNIGDEGTAGKKMTKVTSVYSPIGGSGKTIVSITTALKLAENANEVLYLNFEDISSTSVFFDCRSRNSMSDILYLAKDRNEHLSSEILKYINKDANGVSYIAPIKSVLDFETITRDDIVYFIKAIKSLNKFDNIVIDLSSKFCSLYGGILSISDNVISILINDIESKVKMDAFLKQQESLDKYFFIMNKVKSGENIKAIPEVLKEEKKPVVGSIEYYSPIDGNINGINSLVEKNVFNIAMEQIVQNIYFV